MKTDRYGNPIFEENDIFNLIYQDLNIDQICKDLYVENLDNFCQLSNLQFKQNNLTNATIEEVDRENQSRCFLPTEYTDFDIEGFLAYKCPKQNYQRLIDELHEYRNRNMYDLLRWLKYLVDTMRQNNIVWGVGRGSSVASYVLYLLEIHKIDSVKYKLDFKEFMR